MEDRGEKQSGLTLIELMVAVAILILVASLTTPMMRTVKSNRITSYVHDFVTDLNFARSEAITRGVPVSLCIPDPNNNQTCLLTGEVRKNWENGWLLFADDNGDGQFNIGVDEMLRIQEPMGPNFTLGADNVQAITYQSTGTTLASAGNFELCDPSQEDVFRRRVELNPSGRARILSYEQVDDPGTEATETIVCTVLKDEEA